LGGCNQIRLSTDILLAARSHPNVVFHSTNPTYNLFDFIYQDKDGHYHAFQATMGRTHNANVSMIQDFVAKIGDANASLYYLVPTENFNTFVTSPVEPTVEKCKIWHVLVPNPNDEKKITEQEDT